MKCFCKVRKLVLMMVAGLIGAMGSVWLVPPVWAAGDGGSVESILDRLENRLTKMEHDSLGLPMGENPFLDIEDIDPADMTVNGSSSISGSVKEMDNIRSIATAISRLEGQVDRLAADVQRTKQKVLEGAQIDNFIELQAKLNDTAAAGIKSLSVRIDGYEVFDLHEDSGFWMPSGKLPLYAGPLQPGNHRVDVEVRLVLKNQDSLPVNSDVYRFVNQSFSISVPGTTFRKRWVLEIIPPNEVTDQAMIKLAKSNLN